MPSVLPSNVFIKPASGPDGLPLLVRDPSPSGKPLDPAGEWKPTTQYWLRRLRDKDVVEATATADKPAGKDVGKALGDKKL